MQVFVRSHASVKSIRVCSLTFVVVGFGVVVVLVAGA